MDSSPVIVDISSDDGNDDEDSPFNLLPDLFDNAGELNDVLIVDELPPCLPNKRNRDCSADELICYAVNPKRSCPPPTENDPDDDCLILDGDPDKPNMIPDKNCDSSNDLVVIGEKGPVACRDFPHSRHLCVKFPFKATPHQKFCDLCHCYVCDLPAPCAFWGSGGSPTDHCHSSDREEKWKAQRKNFKLGFSPAASLLPTKATFSMTSTACDPGTPLSLSHGMTLNSIPLQSSVSRSSRHISRDCSNAVGSLPGIIRHRRNMQSTFSHNMDGFPRLGQQRNRPSQNVPRISRCKIVDYFPCQCAPVVTQASTTSSQVMNCSHSHQRALTATSMSHIQRCPKLGPTDNFHLARVEEFLLGDDSELITSQNLYSDGSSEHPCTSSITSNPTYTCPLPASTASNFNYVASTESQSDVYVSNTEVTVADVAELPALSFDWVDGTLSAPLSVDPELPLADPVDPEIVVSEALCLTVTSGDCNLKSPGEPWLFQLQLADRDPLIPELSTVLPPSPFGQSVIGIDGERNGD
ncbi:RPM1 interacting protein 13 [Nymphaea colorata]|nr:RPM1 interacting protein 13 [Nymphaea colorata]